MMYLLKTTGCIDYMNHLYDKYIQERDNGITTPKKTYRKMLVITRMTAQKIIGYYIESMDEWNRLRRMQSKFKYQGVDITPLNEQVKSASNNMMTLKSVVASMGALLEKHLNGWQEHGATYEEFFNFCCCSESTIEKMKQSIAEGETLFVDLIGHHYPDYKYNDDFLDMHNYAPLTHCIREYVCEAVLSLIKSDKDMENIVWDKLNEILYEKEERNDDI